MKKQHIFLFSISLFLLSLAPSSVYSQQADTKKEKDTIIVKNKYGIRIAGDLSKLVRSFVDDNYQGFEVNADYRLTKRLYIAGELGTEEHTLDSKYLNSTANGSYFKAGVDYNMYTNWLEMDNMIYSGFRIGASTFSQTLNSYSIYNTDHYWNESMITSTDAIKFSGLNALWFELQVGIKAEVLTNLFMGAHIEMKVLLNETEPGNFENLSIPGFNRTYDSGGFGFGFGYQISYLIPIYKKDKKVAIDD